jgi:hypothetical protein
MRQLCALLVAAFILVSEMGSVAEAYQQYYDITQHDQAQAEAEQRHLPVAWVGSLPEYSNTGDPKALATQQALTSLQNQAVIILFDSQNTAKVPRIVQAEFEKVDDGPQPQGPNWISPKVVFTDPGITKAISRVSYTQMSGEGTAAAINSALQVIRNTPDVLEPAKPPPPVAANAKINRPAPYTPPPDHTINYIIIILGIPFAWFIYSRARERDAGKK